MGTLCMKLKYFRQARLPEPGHGARGGAGHAGCWRERGCDLAWWYTYIYRNIYLYHRWDY